MAHLFAIGWALWLLAAALGIYGTVGNAALVAMFPEGKRWWHFPSEVIALCHFALVVLYNPWRSSL